MIVHLKKIADRFIVLSESSSEEAWEHFKVRNMDYKGSSEPCYGCHCGLIEVGDQVEDYGIAQEILHVSRTLLVVKV